MRCPTNVCKRKKSLYGLKQAHRSWFHRLSSYIETIGFQGWYTDSSLFVYNQNSLVLYILVHVDDIIITGTQPAAVITCISQLKSEFELRDLSPLKYFLGLEVIR